MSAMVRGGSSKVMERCPRRGVVREVASVSNAPGESFSGSGRPAAAASVGTVSPPWRHRRGTS